MRDIDTTIHTVNAANIMRMATRVFLRITDLRVEISWPPANDNSWSKGDFYADEEILND